MSYSYPYGAQFIKEKQTKTYVVGSAEVAQVLAAAVKQVEAQVEAQVEVQVEAQLAQVALPLDY